MLIEQNTWKYPPLTILHKYNSKFSGYYAMLLLYYMFTRLWVGMRFKNVHLFK